jgi:hypothetical protein
MRTIALVSASLVMITLPVTDADTASNRRCATTPKRSENCGYATLSAGPTCWGSGAGADQIRSLGRRLGPAVPGRPVHRASTEAGIRTQAAE